ncbi:hypothetical protein CONLIGDRAFT_642857 [Coniochaeta ligniaria NRRL 30616]|uniref:Uncharacterized protein n=1 Tax=Coniochaeta ligniaria NRRL 30616 TaxID=1408157 RepID=A0A1J7JSR6_9PEZI|nr:hypothetical protein CONLIGDRAFT_642857 [Coniochaeta ligniaria NRRL 30616]
MAYHIMLSPEDIETLRPKDVEPDAGCKKTWWLSHYHSKRVEYKNKSNNNKRSNNKNNNNNNNNSNTGETVPEEHTPSAACPPNLDTSAPSYLSTPPSGPYSCASGSSCRLTVAHTSVMVNCLGICPGLASGLWRLLGTYTPGETKILYPVVKSSVSIDGTKKLVLIIVTNCCQEVDRGAIQGIPHQSPLVGARQAQRLVLPSLSSTILSIQHLHNFFRLRPAPRATACRPYVAEEDHSAQNGERGTQLLEGQGENNWRLIVSGAVDRFGFVPDQGTPQDEAAELATLEIIDERLLMLISDADKLAERGRQLRYQLRKRKAGIMSGHLGSSQPEESGTTDIQHPGYNLKDDPQAILSTGAVVEGPDGLCGTQCVSIIRSGAISTAQEEGRHHIRTAGLEQQQVVIEGHPRPGLIPPPPVSAASMATSKRRQVSQPPASNKPGESRTTDLQHPNYNLKDDLTQFTTLRRSAMVAVPAPQPLPGGLTFLTATRQDTGSSSISGHFAVGTASNLDTSCSAARIHRLDSLFEGTVATVQSIADDKPPPTLTSHHRSHMRHPAFLLQVDGKDSQARREKEISDQLSKQLEEYRQAQESLDNIGAKTSEIFKMLDE